MTTIRILAIDAALAQRSVAVVADGVVLAERIEPGQRGEAARLAPMVRDVLAASGFGAGELDAVAVTVGPGSFTGIRAALAVAHGLASAIGCPLIGVTVGEALAARFPRLGGRTLWVAIDSRRNRVFLDMGGQVTAVALDRLPPASGRMALAGDAAGEVASRLAARGDDVMLTDARQPLARHVAVVAALRLAGTLPPREAQPLYIDSPEASLPAGGLRPSPVA